MAVKKKAVKGVTKPVKKAAKKGVSQATKGKQVKKATKKAAKKVVKKAAKRTGAKAKSAARGSKSTTTKKAARTTSKKTAVGKAAPTRKGTSLAKKTKSSHDKIKETLFKRREQLLVNLNKLTASYGNVGGRPVGDRVDDAVTDIEVEASYAIAEQEVEELKLIDAALEHIEDGTYGKCEECDQPIGKPRLRALPYAVLCLKCKEVEERERASGGYGF